ncbi:SCP domain-containing protein [Trichostrongylus colubriformis]|uniref:SCP domain-containing protein n=1 Tax=Trichostrongylus colubriformis TaxID=6319 RepID=A0AAN8G4P1_TRICO
MYAFSTHLSILAIISALFWIRAEALAYEGADRDALLTYGFIPDSPEGSGVSEEQINEKDGTDEFYCTSPAMTSEHRKYVVYTHNRLRSKVALGKQPNKHGRMGTGRNIYFLRWDCDLELLAHQRIQACPAYINSNTSNISGSQLVKHIEIRLQGNNILKNIDNSMRSWWLQYERHGNIDPKNRYSTRQHYYAWANMAKGKTTRIGCSYTYCNESMRAIFSCIYNERAHVENQPIYENGKPCTTDDDCSTFPRSECLIALGLCKIPRKVKGKKFRPFVYLSITHAAME